METNNRGSSWGLLLIASPLLIPLLVLIYVTVTRQGVMAPASTGAQTPVQQVQPQPTQPQAPMATSIAWTGSLDWALQTARSSNKPIMIDFGAEW